MKKISLKKYRRKVSKKRGTIAVTFIADYCGASAMMKKLVSELERERKDCRFYYLNVDDEPLLDESFGTMTFPCTFFYKNGKKTGELTGLVGKKKIEKMIG
ncbi:MAG: thioredoxin family protein [Ruminococcaceae bacterium]|nr:thioredoxin family protein [Oscillospiraceae bacterium]